MAKNLETSHASNVQILLCGSRTCYLFVSNCRDTSSNKNVQSRDRSYL